MEEASKALLVVGITLLVVILFNIGIFMRAKRRNDRIGEIELFRQAMKRGQDPWGEEKSDLEELSRKVAQLKARDQTKVEEDDQ